MRYSHPNHTYLPTSLRARVRHLAANRIEMLAMQFISTINHYVRRLTVSSEYLPQKGGSTYPTVIKPQLAALRLPVLK